MRPFYHLLINNGIAAVATFTAWFALIFFVYLETQSVFATGIISGIYLVLTAASGIWFGGLVDAHKKKTMMLVSNIASLGLYLVAAVVFLNAPEGSLADMWSPYLWSMAILLLLGVIAGNIRSIALTPLVTLLIPEERRAKANGLVGMIAGLSFGTVSVISGLLIAYVGMEGVFIFSLVLTVLALIHLTWIAVPETQTLTTSDNHSKKLDLRGTIALVVGIPGLVALILFTTFNNFLGGAFMALLDPYGLSMVSVEVWGLVLGILSLSFMFGGMAIARWGLGKNPLRAMMIANLVIWTTCAFFTIQPWFWLLIFGMFIYMSTFPFIEATEQTVIQKVVPYERQGRVFGFAQSVEQAASPLMAFCIAPLTQFLVIPFMTTGSGALMIGEWFGTGADRGIALVFTIAGVIGILVTILAFNSPQYRMLSARYQEKKEPLI